MSISSVFFIIIIYLISWLTASFLRLKYHEIKSNSRFETVDGLRGFLAIGVLIHHSNIWYTYLQTGVWENPSQNLFIHLGQTSVSFFFMITSFLFINKLLNSIENEFDWRAFFVSRIYRLFPMYYFSVVLIIVCIMTITKWKFEVGVFEYLKSIFDWALFTIVGNPNINNYQYTNMVNAGVIWSLPYEWLFYFSLPLISIIILRKRPPYLVLFISLCFVIVYFGLNGVAQHNLMSFFGGAIAPILMRCIPVKYNVDSIISSLVIILCFALIGFFDTANNVICKLLITIIFTLIGMGCSVFGVLRNSTIKFLGDISYSTYLLHGIVLFIVFNFIIGLEKLKTYTEQEFCFLIFSIVPLIVFFSFLGYFYIEKPFMNYYKIKRFNLNSSNQ